MQTTAQSILRSANRSKNDKLNILTSVTHESYESNLCLTGHNFYAMPGKDIKPWREDYRPRPKNYHLLPSQEIPLGLEFDLVLSQNRFGQYQLLAPFAKKMGIPICTIEHTLPMEWHKPVLSRFKEMRGETNLFISAYSRQEWGWEENEADVIVHGVNTDLFCYPEQRNKSPYILVVVNDFVNRGEILGYKLFEELVKGLPYKLIGDTTPISKPAKDVHELVSLYQNARVFLNTSKVSPIPSVIMEAQSCGVPVVSTSNCMIPEVVDDKVTGFLSNDKTELRQYLELLLEDERLATSMGLQGRERMKEKYSLPAFVGEWNKQLVKTANTVFRG